MKLTGSALLLALTMASITGPTLAADDVSLGLFGVQFLRANVISDKDPFGNVDGRGTLTEMAEKLGFSEAEVDRIRKATGYVVCPGTTYGNPAVGSGALVGGNQQIVTAAHVLIDKAGRKREPLADCYFLTQDQSNFTSQDQPPVTHSFDFSPGHFRFGVEAVRGPGNPSDWAVLRLVDPVEEAEAFSYTAQEPSEGEWMTSIVAAQESPTRTFPDDEPVVQQCRVRGLQHPPLEPLQYITDCDLSPLGSGGVIVTRSDDDALVVRGILIQGGKPKLNGQPYDPSTGSFTRVVSTTGPFAHAIESISRLER